MFAAIRKVLPVLLAGICLFPTLVYTQQNVAQEAPAKRITTVPFTMLIGGIVIVRATLDAHADSLNFILDTGSGGISLDSATCSLLKLQLQRSDRISQGITGAVRAVEFTYGHTLNLPGLAVEHLDFHINDYDILTSVYGIKIDGIIGYSFFRRYIVKLDYDKMKMDVLTTGAFKYPRGGTMLKPRFSTLVMQELHVKDSVALAAKFYYDMGAGLCLLLSKNLVQDSLFLYSKKKKFEVLAQGLGGKAAMSISVVKELKLGPYKFKKVPTYIYDDEYNVTSYPATGGLLGNDVLRRFNVVLNYSKQEIFIKPNGHYRDSFDYAYTGLGIYMINDEITVIDIMKNSPAAKAGFEEGDVVMGVNKNFTGKIDEYKTLLQTVNTTITVLIRNKKGELLTRQLKVKSIL